MLSRQSLLASLLTASVATAAPSTVWHVDARAAPGGDGRAWASAFHTLDAGLAAAQAGDDVWVAAGRYVPRRLQEPGDPRSASFVLPPWVEVYGGFAGHETRLEARAGLHRQTVLSGDLGVPGDARDNAYNVVTCVNLVYVTPQVRLDGFRITGGNADGGRSGGALTVQPKTVGAAAFPILRLERCLLDDNQADRGGAIAVRNLARLLMRDCTVRGNRARERGGGLLSASGHVYCVSSTWSGNVAPRGGALHTTGNGQGTMRFVNSLFLDNAARTGGAACLDSSPGLIGRASFESCTMAFNAAVVGAAVHADWSAQLTLRNSIVWGNASAQGGPIDGSGPNLSAERCDVEGGFPGTGNLDVDPRFIDPLRRDLRTLPGSPVRDAGSSLLLPADTLDLDGDGDTSEPLPLDLDGRRRLLDDPLAPDVGVGQPPLDLGAYEG